MHSLHSSTIGCPILRKVQSIQQAEGNKLLKNRQSLVSYLQHETGFFVIELFKSLQIILALELKVLIFWRSKIVVVVCSQAIHYR